MKLDSYLTPYTKIQNGLKTSMLRPETIKLLEENTRVPCNQVWVVIFLDLTPKAEATKTVINKWNYRK